MQDLQRLAVVVRFADRDQDRGGELCGAEVAAAREPLCVIVIDGGGAADRGPQRDLRLLVCWPSMRAMMSLVGMKPSSWGSAAMRSAGVAKLSSGVDMVVLLSVEGDECASWRVGSPTGGVAGSTPVSRRAGGEFRPRAAASRVGAKCRRSRAGAAQVSVSEPKRRTGERDEAAWVDAVGAPPVTLGHADG